MCLVARSWVVGIGSATFGAFPWFDVNQGDLKRNGAKLNGQHSAEFVELVNGGLEPGSNSALDCGIAGESHERTQGSDEGKARTLVVLIRVQASLLNYCTGVLLNCCTRVPDYSGASYSPSQDPLPLPLPLPWPGLADPLCGSPWLRVISAKVPSGVSWGFRYVVVVCCIFITSLYGPW